MKRAFAVPGFGRLFAAVAVSGLGDAILLLVLSMWVKSLTGSNAMAGLTFLFMLLPTFAAPLIGALVDRAPRRAVVVWGNLASALVVLPLLLVRDASHVWIIWAVAFGYGVSFIVIPTATTALLKDLLPERLLADANASIQTTKEAFRLFGPLVGAWLFAHLGGGAVAVLDAVSFVLAAVIVASLPVGATAVAGAGESRLSRREELLGGIRWIRSDRVLRRTTIGMALMLGVIGASESTIYAMLDELGRPVTFVAVVVTVQSVGAVVGAVLSSRLVRLLGEVATLGAGLVALGGAALGVALAPTIGWVLAGASLLGLTLPVVFVAFTTLQQRRTPTALMGRVAAAVEVLLGVPQAFSLAGGAGLVVVLSYRVIWAGMATVIVLGGLVVLVSLADLVRARAVPGVEPDGVAEGGPVDHGDLAVG